MSYIPDFRGEENEKLLNETDKAFLTGYRAAIEDAKGVFANLEVYEVTEDEKKVLDEFSGCFNDWCEMEEIETVCGIFDGADYLGEDYVLKDANNNPYADKEASK